jgi:precorrin-6B C5,15-methyltransferase / cobalt-precorrin-6B C5,C15-methyltransferase
MTPWLSVIGIGEDGPAGISPAARALLDSAEFVFGGQRHLDLLGVTRAETREWRTPLADTMADIKALRGRPVVVLATGDPLWFGVGVTLMRHFARAEMTIIPHISAFTLAASRMGWPLAECETITLHGRALESLALHLYPGARVLALSEDGGTPAAVARYLTERGWGDSAISVLAHLGGGTETRTDAAARDWGARTAPDLNTIALECRAGRDARVFARVGLPDDAFAHDGQLTKREVRAATLASLAPLPGQMLWDVGAGCGSIGIEWMRGARAAQAIAIERDEARCALIARNAAALGAPRLKIVRGEAPASLAGLPAPDAVFIGGGISPALVDACWAALKSGGRIAANVVTLEGEAAVLAAAARLGGELSRIQVSRAEPVGALRGWRAMMPVTLFHAVKP